MEIEIKTNNPVAGKAHYAILKGAKSIFFKSPDFEIKIVDYGNTLICNGPPDLSYIFCAYFVHFVYFAHL